MECSRMFHKDTVQRRNNQSASRSLDTISFHQNVVCDLVQFLERTRFIQRKGVLSIYIRTMSVSSWAWSFFLIVLHPKFLSAFPRWWLFVRCLMNLMWNVFSVDRRGLFELVWADFSASFSQISQVRVKVNEDFSPRPRQNWASVDGVVLRLVRLLRECTSRRSRCSDSWSRCRSSYRGVVPPTSAGRCRS